MIDRLKKIRLIGIVENGLGHATGRLDRCGAVLKEHGISFPPFKLGTLNIRLNEPYFTPANKAFLISQDELDNVDRGYNEHWYLIPVLKINHNESLSYIYRTSTNYHGNYVVELIAHDLEDKGKVGQRIILDVLDDGPSRIID